MAGALAAGQPSHDVLELKDGTFLERYSHPLLQGEHVRGRIWTLRDVTRLRAAEAEREELHERERHARRDADGERSRMSFLAEASRLLVSFDYRSALSGVAQLAVPFLADWCAIDLIDERGQLERVASASIPALAEVSRELESLPAVEWQSGIHAVRGEEGSAASTSYVRLLQRLDMDSYLSVLLTVPGKTLGAATFVSATSERRFMPRDLWVAENLASRAALAIENARLYGTSEAALRIRDEFISLASHELNTPVTSLLLSLQNLKAYGVSESDQASAVVARAERQCRHPSIVNALCWTDWRSLPEATRFQASVRDASTPFFRRCMS